ncbi:MAG TPA: alpha-glucan family phosphorylase [Anaerolineales bacterium]|nr:alpha-glucan family phosphorylase [Anaerolineales bacterium]
MEPFRTEIPNHLSLPRRIRRLGELAYNLWWTWNPDAQRLFLRIDRDLWERTKHNPVRFLRLVDRASLNAVTQDRYYLEFFDRTFRAYDQYMRADDTWCSRNQPEFHNQPIAYFSTEFGLHETLPIYAGGLGVLSGDHLKAASDLGLPLVAIGFLYTKGYFSQHITEDGWQEAHSLRLKFEELPILPVLTPESEPVTVSVELPGRELKTRLWKIQVGRIPLYLLDSDVEANQPNDRDLTARLYNSDLELRISQEIILGVGGVRALRILGFNPSGWHLNEGHSAFLNLERAREMVASGHSFEEAIERIRQTTSFTTHTPVPAGNDEFPLWLMDKYFSQLWPELGLDREGFINLARHQNPWGDVFSMPVLALRLADQCNGVSEMHGVVARKMWHHLWPELREEEVPITHITNGVHTGSWLARRLRHLNDRYLGPAWLENLDDPQTWEKIEDIPDAELWTVRKHLKRKLVAYMRERARDQWLKDNVHPVQVIAAGVLLDPYALTIGCARRFATYKRANLILRDIGRLLDIINRPNMPVQIIFAGKAHPADEPGKLLIQEVYRAVKKSDNGGRLVFLEDYDMNLARYLLQGVDVWLNTPRRPYEASGTSGMKAAMNGVLNFSVLDGWWREGYNGQNGWAIGADKDYEDPNQQDQVDAESLYDILENQIIPLYYQERSSDGLPGEWIGCMKQSIRTLAPQFSARRMVKEYIERLYLPALQSRHILSEILDQ